MDTSAMDTNDEENVQDSPNHANSEHQIGNLVSEMMVHVEFQTEKHINHLPDLVLRNIFSKFRTLKELLVLGHVCTYWNTLLNGITFQLSHLTILICPTHLKDEGWGFFCDRVYECNESEHLRAKINYDGAQGGPRYVPEDKGFAVLHYEHLHPSTIREIVDAMPSVTSLTITMFNYEAEEIDPVIRLLNTTFGSRLIKLYFTAYRFGQPKMNEDTRLEQEQTQLARLLSTIETELTALECLIWDCDETHNFSNRLNVLIGREWPFISRLRELHYLPISYRITEDELLNSLARYASSDRLERIVLNKVLFTYAHLLYSPFTGKIDSKLYHKFVLNSAVVMQTQPVFITNLRQFVSEFTGSTKLYLEMKRSVSLVQVLGTLTPLAQLTQLTLKMDRYYGAAFSGDDEHSIKLLTPFPSVKLLCLGFFGETHSNVCSQHWGRLFPSVQVCELAHICDESHSRLSGSKVGEDIDRGFMELFRVLVPQFPQLRACYTQYPYWGHWTREQIQNE